MTVVLLLWRTRLRSSWRSAIVLVVLIGLAGAVSLAVAAGARRTASANDAVLEAGNASDVVTSFGLEHPDAMAAALRSVPDVSGVDMWLGFVGRPEGVDPASITNILGFWSDPLTIDRPFLQAGRFPTGPREAYLNEPAAARSGLRVGSKLRVALANVAFDDFETVEVDIVGIGLFPEAVIEDELGEPTALWFSRALTEEHLDRQFYGSARLTLARGDIPAVAAGLASLQPPAPPGAPDDQVTSADNDMVIGELRDQDRDRVQKALRPLVWALGGLSALAGGATVLVAAQAFGRALRRRRVDDQSLAAMGCTTRQLVSADLAYTSSVTAAGILVALALAVAASPLFPLGPPRRVAAIGGVDVDLVALAVGSLLLATAIIVGVGAASWRSRASTRTMSPGRAPGFLGSRPAPATGLRLVTGRRRTGSMTAGVCAGLAAVVAVLTFTGSLDHLAGKPALVGMGWDLIGREGYTTIDVPQVRAAVEGARSPTARGGRAGPAVKHLSGLGYLDGTLNGVTTPVAAVSSVIGDPWPPIVAGRAPMSTSEILVGGASLRALRLSQGDKVDVSLTVSNFDGSVRRSVVRTFLIVGSPVTPAIGLGGVYTPRLDVGALLPPGAYEEMSGTPVRSDVLLFDLADRVAASSIIERFPDGLPDDSGNPTEWFTTAVPAEISQAEDARRVIWIAVTALGFAVVATIAHTLLGFVLQRRRDYAVLKALGFSRGQIRTTVLTQSGAVLALALVVALPLGAAAGRWLWTAFAARIGVVVEPVVPLLLLAACALLSILAVQGAALIPASLARRTPPGRTLHGE